MSKVLFTFRSIGLPQHWVDHFFPDRKYIMRRTGYTVSYTSEKCRILCNTEYLPFKYLGMGGQFKAYVKRRIPKLKLWRRLPSPTYMARPANGPAVELDLEKFYINVGVEIGLLDEEWRHKLCTIPKKYRLKVMGRIASEPTVETWNGGMVSCEKEKSETRPVWDTIVGRAYEIMRGVAADDREFYAFWVDNAFVHPKAAPDLIDRFSAAGYVARTERTDLRVWTDGSHLIIPKFSPLKLTEAM